MVPQAEEILQNGRADLVAVARTVLDDPYWPAHQARAMGADNEFSTWPQQYGWWLTRRAKGLRIIPGQDKG